MICKNCKISETTDLVFKDKFGKIAFVDKYHICPLYKNSDPDWPSDYYPDDFNCIDEKRYLQILKESKR
jgi:hypothetical protein